MKTNSYFFKNFLVFLFFIFTTTSFSQSNNCAATPTLTIGTTCTTTNYNVESTFSDSGVAESCTGTSWRDGWYTFTTGASTTLITINGTSDKRLGLALYTGACGSLSEVICTTPGTANANISNQIVLPNTTYRLRLMRTNNNNNNDMTGTICVIDTTPAPCAGTPNAGTTTTTPNTGWPGSNYTVSATGYSIASNLTFQWQFSTDAGATWTNAGAATGTYSNYSATAPASGIVHWRLVVTCTNSSNTATSTTGIFTTMAVSNVVTGCPNVVSGGLGLNGADPATINCTATSTCVNLEATYLDLGETTDYIVEAIAYNPPRSFSGLANPISVNTDDVYSPIVNLPFDFCFYGNKYTQCVIGSNVY